MKCPECKSNHIHKNGHRGQKQNYICVNCRRQFIDIYETKGYRDGIKCICLKMDVNGMRFRGIERVTGVSRTTIMDWVKQVGKRLPDAYNPETIPEVGELDELETFVGKKKNKVWIWTAVDHFKAGILGWAMGEHSANTFQGLWQCISFWKCYF